MNVLIISGGKVGDIEVVKRMIPPCDYVICADGGTRYAESFGVLPDIILGDFDSLPGHILEHYRQAGVPVKRYPRDKDRTDTQIAVDLAIEMKARCVFIVGALGSRWDHAYANVLLLCRLAQHGIKGKIIDEHNIIVVSNDHIEIEGEVGSTLSLLPLGEDVYIHFTEGLKYPVEDALLPIDFPFGVSNEFVKPKAIVKIRSGWVVAVKSRD